MPLDPEGSRRVPDYGSPTVRRRRLAAELRRLRERAGFTGDEVADRLGWSASKISRIELHRTGIKQPDLLSLLDLYGIDDQHRDDLLALARESTKTGWLETVAANVRGDYAALLRAEAEAQSVWNWEPQVIPGLLQTPEYARAVMLGWHQMFDVPPGDVERRVEARLVRQQVLERDPPLMVSAVIDESVLHRRLGDNSVMRGQLKRLSEVAELANVTIQILPLNGDHVIGTGAFIYWKFAQVHDIPLHDIVNVEHLTGSWYIEEEEDTYQYLKTFEALIETSLAPPDSLHLISRIAHEIWSS
jgi:transcriptional regulator with XRE-family HTH domain